MLPLIEVECPHCHAQGRIVTPPLGSVIVGPCPECSGKVVVFCGKVLALEESVMSSGNPQEKQDHLMEVLGVFIHSRIETLFSENPDADEKEHFGVLGEKQKADVSASTRPAAPIGEDEIKNFVNGELHKLDDPEYFRSVFEH